MEASILNHFLQTDTDGKTHVGFNRVYMTTGVMERVVERFKQNRNLALLTIDKCKLTSEGFKH